MATVKTTSKGSYSSREEVDDKLRDLRATFQSGRTKDLKYRKWQLKQLFWLIDDHEKTLCAALEKDLGRHPLEALTDISGIKGDVFDHIKNLEEWTADEHPDVGFIFGTVGKTVIRKEPLGTVLVIGAWNFPILLILSPLAAAIAAGCTALLKPSELATESERVVYDLLPKYLDPKAYAVVTGGPQETTYILEQKFNHIFFTGSTPVAKHIAAAAAKHLTPTVLELGGQGPSIVTKKANVDLAAKRILWAKHFNAGQICLSVNHVFVDPEVYDQFAERLNFWAKTFLGDLGEMAHVINERNYDRLKDALDRSKGQKLVGKGDFDRVKLRIPLTVIGDVKLDDSLLEQELFGPLLPVIKADYHEAIRQINTLPNPLGLYIFSDSQEEIDHILNNTLSGGVTINDCLLHASGGLPFGGVGDSGSGSYHGKYGVEAFTHKRSVVRLPHFLDKVMGFRYPPYDMKFAGRYAIKNTLGFKKGERLEDQKIRKPGRENFAKLVFVVGLITLVGGSQNALRPQWLQGVFNGLVQRLAGLVGA